MVLYKGSQRMGAVYYGSKKISKIYKGSQLLYAADPYKPGVVILEKSVAGTYSFTLNTKRKVQVIMVGAGGGGAWARYAATYKRTENGGSGAMLQGTMTLNAGIYTVVVGQGGTSAKQDRPMYESAASSQSRRRWRGICSGRLGVNKWYCRSGRNCDCINRIYGDSRCRRRYDRRV